MRCLLTKLKTETSRHFFLFKETKGNLFTLSTRGTFRQTSPLSLAVTHHPTHLHLHSCDSSLVLHVTFPQRQVNSAGAEWVRVRMSSLCSYSHFSCTFHKVKDIFSTSAYKKMQQATVSSNASVCIPGRGHASGMDKAAVQVWGYPQKTWSTLWGLQTFSQELYLWLWEAQPWSSHPMYSTATCSKPYHDFSLDHTDPTITRWTSWHQHLSAEAWSMCEKIILTVRLWSQIHKDYVAMISGLGTHCMFSFIKYSEAKQ